MTRRTDPDHAVLPAIELARIGKLISDEIPADIGFILVVIREREGSTDTSTVGLYCAHEEGRILKAVGEKQLAGKSIHGGKWSRETGHQVS